jgi:hypothetical protein
MTSAILSPLFSELGIEEREASYTEWFEAKARASLDDTRPNIPHGKVTAEARALLTSKQEKRVAD